MLNGNYFNSQSPVLWSMITSLNGNIFRVEIHRLPVNSPHKGQWRGTLVFSWICSWINGRVNNREAGDLRRHSAHYDDIVLKISTQHPDEKCDSDFSLSGVCHDFISNRLCEKTLVSWLLLNPWNYGRLTKYHHIVWNKYFQGPHLLTWVHFNTSMNK